MQKNKNIYQYSIEFCIYLFLAYVINFNFLEEYYNFILISSSLMVASLFDMSVYYDSNLLNEIKFITNPTMYNPTTLKTLKTGFIIEKDILELSNLILFKLPLFIATILTFSKKLKPFLISIGVVLLVQFIYGFIIITEMMFVASSKNIFLTNYLNGFGIDQSFISFLSNLRLFFYAWFQKFLPLILAFYLYKSNSLQFGKAPKIIFYDFLKIKLSTVLIKNIKIFTVLSFITLVSTNLNAAQEIDITGNSISIASGSAAIAAGNHTDFGTAHVKTDTVVRTFTISNTGDANLTVGAASVVTGTHFSVTLQPGTPVIPGGTTTFQITFNPTTAGVGAVTDTVSIINDDSDEGPYTFAIGGTGTYSEINVTGNGINITDGGGAQDTTDDTYFGSKNINTGTSTKTFTILNHASSTDILTISNIAVSGDFSVSSNPAPTTVGIGSSTTFTITFDPIAVGNRTGIVTITNDDTTDLDGNDESSYTFSIKGVGDLNVTKAVSLTENGLNIEYPESTGITTSITPSSSAPTPVPETPYLYRFSGAINISVTGGANGFSQEFALNLADKEHYVFLGALKYGVNMNSAGQSVWYDFGKKEDNDLSGIAEKVGIGYSIVEDRKKMLVYLRDGAWGDNDITANGTITDPLFPLIGLITPISKKAYLLLAICVLFIGLYGIRKKSFRS